MNRFAFMFFAALACAQAAQATTDVRLYYGNDYFTFRGTSTHGLPVETPIESFVGGVRSTTSAAIALRRATQLGVFDSYAGNYSIDTSFSSASMIYEDDNQLDFQIVTQGYLYFNVDPVPNDFLEFYYEQLFDFEIFAFASDYTRIQKNGNNIYTFNSSTLSPSGYLYINTPAYFYFSRSTDSVNIFEAGGVSVPNRLPTRIVIGDLTGVPDVSSWLTMLVGFLGIGSLLRLRRQRITTAAN